MINVSLFEYDYGKAKNVGILQKLHLDLVIYFNFQILLDTKGENLPTIAAFLCIYKFHPMSRTINKA